MCRCGASRVGWARALTLASSLRPNVSMKSISITRLKLIQVFEASQARRPSDNEKHLDYEITGVMGFDGRA